LLDLLRAAGLVDVEAEAHTRLDRLGEYRRTHLVALTESTREKLVARGLVSEDHLADQLGALAQHLADTHTIVAGELLFQAWGRKPMD
jgi:RNase adaptor protein for sRNA GlmZ degradation